MQDTDSKRTKVAGTDHVWKKKEVKVREYFYCGICHANADHPADLEHRHNCDASLIEQDK